MKKDGEYMMTTQLPISKERLEEIANFKSDLANKPFIYEDARRMACALLAGMKQKPVAYDQQQRDLMNSIVARAMKNNLERGDKLVMADVFAATMALMQAGFRIHPAPSITPAPVAVPDEDLFHMAASAIEDLLSNKDRSGAGVWADVPAKLRRAAMLNGDKS